jgi:hypothetical protein
MMFRGKNMLSYYTFVLLEGNYGGVVCPSAFSSKQPWHFWQVLSWQDMAVKGLNGQTISESNQG